MAAIHNPTSTPLVYDLEGHIVDAYGRVDGADLADPHTAGLLDAGIVTIVPETPDTATPKRGRRSDGEDS